MRGRAAMHCYITQHKIQKSIRGVIPNTKILTPPLQRCQVLRFGAAHTAGVLHCIRDKYDPLPANCQLADWSPLKFGFTNDIAEPSNEICWSQTHRKRCKVTCEIMGSFEVCLQCSLLQCCSFNVFFPNNVCLTKLSVDNVIVI